MEKTIEAAVLFAKRGCYKASRTSTSLPWPSRCWKHPMFIRTQFLSPPGISDAIHWFRIHGGFLKKKRATPSSHPFLDGIFPFTKTNQLLGYPHSRKPPYLPLSLIDSFAENFGHSRWVNPDDSRSYHEKFVKSPCVWWLNHPILHVWWLDLMVRSP